MWGNSAAWGSGGQGSTSSWAPRPWARFLFGSQSTSACLPSTEPHPGIHRECELPLCLGDRLSGDADTLTAVTQNTKCKDEVRTRCLENAVVGLSAKYFAGEMQSEQGLEDEETFTSREISTFC